MKTQKVAYLKADRGRWFYRRRVPQRHQKTLGEKTWNRPCGDVSFQKAVTLVTGWAEEDDALIKSLDDPEVAEKTRYHTEFLKLEPAMIKVADALTDMGMEPGEWRGSDLIAVAKAGIKEADKHPEQSTAARLVAYRSILHLFFGNHVVVPRDHDERDEYDLIKRKLDRRINDLAGDQNTISSVAERYYEFADVKLETRNKYRRNIKKLIEHIGDIPLPHVSARLLREFRDVQFRTMKASSLHSVFVPIKGLFAFAVEHEIISESPAGIDLQKEKRSIQERKWKPFTPKETQRIFDAMDRFWGLPLRGMSDERRRAIWMAVRVQAFTAMRPKEVLWLEPEDVCNRWIKIRESKTVGSDRTIPMHPKIADFPDFIHSGGFNTFKSQEKDRVQTVRHNFQRLIRDFMDPPIIDKKKVLYSFRSTFSNAMRRAGADAEMRRAILGHAEAGALKHYDDGPEFAKKRKWVRASDPRTDTPDSGEDDDLD